MSSVNPHPDLTIVLQRRNVAKLLDRRPSSRSADAPVDGNALEVENFAGEKVLCSFSVIPNVKWAVFVELPLQEAYEPMYAALLPTSGFIILSIGIALLTSLYLARRVIRPLEVLRAGVDRIGHGDLNHLLHLKTGDEIEVLADEFNKMTHALKQSYAGLEASRPTDSRVAGCQRAFARAGPAEIAFSLNVSHELKPAGRHRRLVENMLDGVTGPLNEKQISYIGGIKESSERLARLINDLLDLSVIESGKMTLANPVFAAGSCQRSHRSVTAGRRGKERELDGSANGGKPSCLGRSRQNDASPNKSRRQCGQIHSGRGQH
jgi:HAMP domain-containing protein